MELRVCKRRELSEAEAAGVLDLWQRVWPDADFESEGLEDRVAEFLNEPPDARDGEERFHLVGEGAVLLGVARSFLREIRFLELDQSFVVIALAGVCSCPKRRGSGIGKQVVQSVFDRIGRDAELCLFQTGSPGFYEKMGAVSVDTVFVNSLAASGSGERPWWDEFVMIRGDLEKWQKGRVDLLGPAY